jgi:hypothetical protein
MAPSKGLSTRNVFRIGHMVICACGLLPNPAKVPNFQYSALLCSLDQKFDGDDENPENLNFETWHIRHDGILSIGNFMLMINNHFARFQLPGNLLKTKKMCSLFSWQHAISYLFFLSFIQLDEKKN